MKRDNILFYNYFLGIPGNNKTRGIPKKEQYANICKALSIPV